MNAPFSKRTNSYYTYNKLICFWFIWESICSTLFVSICWALCEIVNCGICELIIDLQDVFVFIMLHSRLLPSYSISFTLCDIGEFFILQLDFFINRRYLKWLFSYLGTRNLIISGWNVKLTNGSVILLPNYKKVLCPLIKKKLDWVWWQAHSYTALQKVGFLIDLWLGRTHF